MKRTDFLKMAAAAGAAFTISAVAGFSVMSGAFGASDTAYASENTALVSEYTSESEGELVTAADEAEDAAATADLGMVSGGALDTSDMFTSRDLEQEADLSEAQSFTITDGQTIEITTKGVYVITGTAKNASIIVNAGDEDKVQIVLDGVSITNDSTPCIYVKSADKVFVTTTGTENTLAVTGTFTADGDTNTDAVIFSKDDLVLNGTGTLTIQSSDNGITSKDDLKITGGTINISCTADALEANDSIRIADGTINIKTNKDALHAENDDDDTVGFVYICGGTLNVQSDDDAVHATTIIQIDGGELNLAAHEGLEATWIQINGGTINISCTADALEANDSIRIADGTINIKTNKDALHAENDEDDTVGFVYICGGTLNVESDDDAIHATTIIQIDDGELNLTAHEGLEATWIQINGGTINIQASDDAINASYKSAKITPVAEFNGGYVTIVMGSGDTDAVDSNGNLVITGGTLDITAQSPFDYDGTCQKTGGTLIVNGTETDTISNQMMGGRGGKNGMGGGRW